MLPTADPESVYDGDSEVSLAMVESSMCSACCSENELTIDIECVTVKVRRTNNKEQQQIKPILMWEVGLIFPIVILYATARGYMTVEVFASLRQLPLGVYETFDIGGVFPHW